MNILAIETSYQSASVAVYKDNDLAAFCCDDAINMQAENLFPIIGQAFIDSKLGYSDLQYIAVTNGPGSFTGIRIGLSAVKGIMLAAPHISSLVFSNLQVACFTAIRQLSNRLRYIVVILQATSSELYIQTFNFDLTACLDPEIISINHLADYLSRYDERIALIGNAINLVLDRIINNSNLIILPRFAKIDARSLGSLAILWPKFAKSLLPEPVPLYIKPASVNLVSKNLP
jgi:tRNA threonylcarbamoyladenosine biosynthesis protein TsaB